MLSAGVGTGGADVGPARLSISHNQHCGRSSLQPLLDDRSPGEPLFVRADGRPFDRWRMTTALRRAATAAGVDHTRLTPHTARATAATAALDAGVPLADVQELLGHASPVTTQRYNRPDRGPVTCRRCLKLTHTDPAGEQLELFPEPEQASGGA
ncbi:tyrosine-type recombinase/integrase [Streptosporangium sp. NPDC003464]